jgi:hypothetical protein
MMKKFKPENIDLCMTDTDSLIYHIRKEDPYKVMLDNKDKFNDKLGGFKDEVKENYITEYVGIRPKVYSYTTDNKEYKKCKSINKCITEKLIRHQDYLDCVMKHKDKYIVQNSIVSVKHQLYTMSERRRALSGCDDKVYICDDGINTLAHGHYKTKM